MTTLSAAKRGGGRQSRWTREAVITKIQEWVSLYGEPPRAADWNPSSAKWSGQTWRIARYEAGDWPSLNAAKRPFGGSLNAAIVAAGFEPNKSGPPAYRKDVAPVVDDHLDAHPLVKAALGAARSEVSALTEKVEVRDRQLSEVRRVRDRLKEELAKARSERKPARPITKTKTKVKVVKERDLDALRVAKAQTKEARTAATRAVSARERAEAKAQTTIADLREQLRAAKAERLAMSVEMRKALDRAAALAAQAGEVVEIEVIKEVEKVVERVVELRAPEQVVVDEAKREAMLARRDAAAAEKRAERSDRAYFELANAVKGERRRLTPGEMSELRESGPSGPAVLAEALKVVARARSGNGDLREALTLVASAALTWKDRLG